MTLEDEARTEAEAWAAAEEYAPGDVATQDDFVTGWLTALRRDPFAAVRDFIAWADASPAVTWTGRLGLKERWEHRNDPEYQEMLRKLKAAQS